MSKEIMTALQLADAGAGTGPVICSYSCQCKRNTEAVSWFVFSLFPVVVSVYTPKPLLVLQNPFILFSIHMKKLG